MLVNDDVPLALRRMRRQRLEEPIDIRGERSERVSDHREAVEHGILGSGISIEIRSPLVGIALNAVDVIEDVGEAAEIRLVHRASDSAMISDGCRNTPGRVTEPEGGRRGHHQQT